MASLLSSRTPSQTCRDLGLRRLVPAMIERTTFFCANLFHPKASSVPRKTPRQLREKYDQLPPNRVLHEVSRHRIGARETEPQSPTAEPEQFFSDSFGNHLSQTDFCIEPLPSRMLADGELWCAKSLSFGDRRSGSNHEACETLVA